MKKFVTLSLFLAGLLLSNNLTLLERYDPGCRELLDVEVIDNENSP